MQIEHEATTAVLYLLAIRGTWISFTDSRKRYHATVPCALAMRALYSRLPCNETLSNAKNYESYVSIRSGNELFKKSFINRHKRRSTLGKWHGY